MAVWGAFEDVDTTNHCRTWTKKNILLSDTTHDHLKDTNSLTCSSYTSWSRFHPCVTYISPSWTRISVLASIFTIHHTMMPCICNINPNLGTDEQISNFEANLGPSNHGVHYDKESGPKFSSPDQYIFKMQYFQLCCESWEDVSHETHLTYAWDVLLV